MATVTNDSSHWNHLEEQESRFVGTMRAGTGAEAVQVASREVSEQNEPAQATSHRLSDAAIS